MPGLTGLSGLSGLSGLTAQFVPVGQYDGVVNMVHAYEPARCLLTAYDGQPLVRLRRDSDDAELDFSNVSTENQDLNLAAIAAWAGGASYEVTKNDQVGGDDVTQAAAASQPLFDLAVRNGHAGAVYDGLDDYQQGPYTTGGALSQPFSVYAVAQLDASVVNDGLGTIMIDSDDATNRNIMSQVAAPTPDGWALYSGTTLVDGDSDSNWNLWAALFNGASSELWINTVSKASGDAGAHNPDGLTIGASYLAGTPWKGPICSVIIVDPAHSDAQRIACEALGNAYWANY